MSRSARLLIGGMRRSRVKRSTSSPRSRSTFSSTRPSGWVTVLAGPGVRRTIGEADGHAVPEAADPHRPASRREPVPALGAGEVGGVDQAAQCGGDLAGPHGIGVGLGTVLEIA